jgi:hypothetical protein
MQRMTWLSLSGKPNRAALHCGHTLNSFMSPTTWL